MESCFNSSFVNGGDSQNISLLSLLMAPEDETPCTIQNPSHFVSPKSEPDIYDYNASLSDLISLENQQAHPTTAAEIDSYSLESIVEDYFRHSKKKQKQKKRVPQSKTICEKAYCLGKLLPGANSCSRRRSTVEVLEEAHKYIRFLQAQVCALRSMPVESWSSSSSSVSRKQVLQVVVHSPGAQALMAENGCCVVAAEQVALINKIEARNRLIHHLLANIPL